MARRLLKKEKHLFIHSFNLSLFRFHSRIENVYGCQLRAISFVAGAGGRGLGAMTTKLTTTSTSHVSLGWVTLGYVGLRWVTLGWVGLG